MFAAFAQGFALSASLTVSIGAQNMFLLRQGLKREHVLPIVLFCAVAEAALVLAGVNGLAAVLQLVPSLSLAMSVGGAAFLTWYAVGALRRAGQPSALVVQTQAGMTLGAAMAGTAAFTLLNPHVYIDTVMLMGAVGASLPGAERPLFVAGAAMFGLAWFSALGFGARFLAPLFARPAAWRILDAATGAMMLTIAAALIHSAFF